MRSRCRIGAYGLAVIRVVLVVMVVVLISLALRRAVGGIRVRSERGIRRRGEVLVSGNCRIAWLHAVRWLRVCCWGLCHGELGLDKRVQVGDAQRDGCGQVRKDVVAWWR